MPSLKRHSKNCMTAAATVLGRRLNAGCDRRAASPNFRSRLPLPPLVGREWGAEATHPDIPWGPIRRRWKHESQQPSRRKQPQQPDANGGSEFGSASPAATAPASIRGSGAVGLVRTRWRFRSRRRIRTTRMVEGPGMRSWHGSGTAPLWWTRTWRSRRSRRRYARRRWRLVRPPGQHTTLTKGVDYYLLRFFDFSVEPGKNISTA